MRWHQSFVVQEIKEYDMYSLVKIMTSHKGNDQMVQLVVVDLVLLIVWLGKCTKSVTK